MEKIFSRVMKDIDDNMIDMSYFNSKVVLVVNTASKSNLIKQLEGYERLYNKYKNQDFEVIVFPSNDFRDQEPLTNEEIANLYRNFYGATYLIMEKIHVVNDTINPLYELLFEKSGSRPEGNFSKYIVNRGKAVFYFSPTVGVDDVEARIIATL